MVVACRKTAASGSQRWSGGQNSTVTVNRLIVVALKGQKVLEIFHTLFSFPYYGDHSFDRVYF